ncbi:hypothetical protein AAF712_016367 [Marasmius tenuissimus]|uniref:G domain-containing protein n=1 Tax=Marasmius tenuissimus TaxID=585030 RepID=A0ABR2Z957_9AGAR
MGESIRRMESTDADPAIIAVMGTTGSGKSTFINLASGGQLDVGDTLQSCTNVVDLSPAFLVGSKTVLLVDTPGFDDTTKTETEILSMLATYLADMFKQNQKLAGMIYLHRISDVRVGGMSARNFRMFRELCGEDSLKNVVIVTNRWEEVPKDVGDAREEELRMKDIFFKPALDKSARMVRHRNTYESASAIMKSLMGNTPLPLLIQEEMVTQGKHLLETAAGEVVNHEISEVINKLKAELEMIKDEMQDFAMKSDEARQELHSSKAALQYKLAEAEENAQILARDYNELKVKYEEMLRRTQAAAEQKVGELQAQLKGLKKKKRGKKDPRCIIM